MLLKAAVLYNEPLSDRYQAMGEARAIEGVLDEVKAVGQVLLEQNYSPVFVPLRPPLERARALLQALDADIYFNLFEGFDGSPETEARFASILVELKKSFTGCPPAALELALDKARTKELFKNGGILTPGFQVVSNGDLAGFHLDFPCIVKPLAEDASHGITESSVVYDPDSLKQQVAKISSLFRGRVLVEEFLEGREFNTTVMGTGARLTVPAVSEIVYTLPPDKPRLLTFEAKWDEQSQYYLNTKAVCPAKITGEQKSEISRIARLAFTLTGCAGYARVDIRQDALGRFNVLEVNPNPDITPGSGAALQAAAAGWDYCQFIEKIISYARKRKQR